EAPGQAAEGKGESTPCRYCSRVSAWLFLSNIFSGMNRKWFPKLSHETAHQHYSFSADNDNSNIWAPLWKANEMESPAQEQRDPESYWIKEQPCKHCKAQRTWQWISRHFFKPVDTRNVSEKNP
uniref:Uncharacterized protein n=1 Tax=Falco tinnunculus TaxID=100819 RepID=A0A8C4UV28_FALTI